MNTPKYDVSLVEYFHEMSKKYDKGAPLIVLDGEYVPTTFFNTPADRIVKKTADRYSFRWSVEVNTDRSKPKADVRIQMLDMNTFDETADMANWSNLVIVQNMEAIENCVKLQTAPGCTLADIHLQTDFPSIFPKPDMVADPAKFLALALQDNELVKAMHVLKTVIKKYDSDHGITKTYSPSAKTDNRRIDVKYEAIQLIIEGVHDIDPKKDPRVEALISKSAIHSVSEYDKAQSTLRALKKTSHNLRTRARILELGLIEFGYLGGVIVGSDGTEYDVDLVAEERVDRQYKEADKVMELASKGILVPTTNVDSKGHNIYEVA